MSVQTMGRPLTGRAVLLIILGFFGTVGTVNAVMIYSAVSTFRGEEADHPYEAGLAYNGELDAARAQASLGWKVSGRISAIAAGRYNLAVDARDSAELPLSNLDVEATLESPVDRARDVQLTLAASPDGLYRGELAAHPGQWVLVIAASAPGTANKFLSRSRLTLD